MNGSSTTSPNTSARRRVTDVAQVVFATGIEAVCVAGQRVALRFGTAQGIVIVHCPLAAFVEKARAPHDHHGRPFAAANPRAIEEADAAAVPVTIGGPSDRVIKPPVKRYGQTGLPQALRDKLLYAFQNHKGGADTARELRISANTAYTYFRRFRAKLKKAERPLCPKPSGKLL